MNSNRKSHSRQLLPPPPPPPIYNLSSFFLIYSCLSELLFLIALLTFFSFSFYHLFLSVSYFTFCFLLSRFYFLSELSLILSFLFLATYFFHFLSSRNPSKFPSQHCFLPSYYSPLSSCSYFALSFMFVSSCPHACLTSSLSLPPSNTSIISSQLTFPLSSILSFSSLLFILLPTLHFFPI